MISRSSPNLFHSVLVERHHREHGLRPTPMVYSKVLVGRHHAEHGLRPTPMVYSKVLVGRHHAELGLRPTPMVYSEVSIGKHHKEEDQGDRDKISSWMKARVTEIRSRPDEKTKTTREEYLRGSKPSPPARITPGGTNQDLPRGLPPGEQAKTTREDYLRGGKPRPPAR